MKNKSSDKEKNEKDEKNMNEFPGNIDIYDASEFSVQFKKKESCGCKLLCPIYKIFFKYPAKITKLLFQIGDLYCFIEILCFNLQFFLILITSAARIPTVGQIFIFIGLFLFSLIFGNPLTVPLWEFIQFRWLKNILFFQTCIDIWRIGYDDEKRIKNDKCDKNSINENENNNNNDKNTKSYKNSNNDNKNNDKNSINDDKNAKSDKSSTNDDRNNKKVKKCCFDNKMLDILDCIINLVLGAFFYVYLVLLAIGNPAFDYFTMLIVLIVPSIKVFLIYLFYIIIIIKYGCLEHKYYYDPFVLSMKNAFFSHHNENEETSMDDAKQEKKVFLIFKLIGIAFGLCYMIWISFHFKVNALMVVNFLLFWLYNAFFALVTQMPIWIFNYFKNWDCGHIIDPDNGINKKIREDPRFKGFKYVNSICTFIIPLLIIAYAFFLFSSSSSTFSIIESQTLWNGTRSHYYDTPTKSNEIMSAMCFTQVYHLNFLQIGSIAAAAYYNDTETVKLYLNNSFFSDDNLVISYLDFELSDDNHAVLLRADIDIKDSSKNLTIFAVRGSTTAVDWWLDFEIFISSALLSFARWFPIVNNFESVTARAISRYMTFPLYTMYQATLSYQYTSEMFEVIDNFTNYYPERTILFTGHSLGGGLSKVLACKYAKQSVSFSGPGISAIENKFKPNNFDKYFKSKYIDVVPDNDFVPRFELSGGTRHRVLCQQNGGECHSILRTLCQIGLSCDFEKYTGDFCRGRYSKDEYDEMMELADYSR